MYILQFLLFICVFFLLCAWFRKGIKSEDGEESSCTHSAKPPPLLEEELALTVSSLIRPPERGTRCAAVCYNMQCAMSAMQYKSRTVC